MKFGSQIAATFGSCSLGGLAAQHGAFFLAAVDIAALGTLSVCYQEGKLIQLLVTLTCIHSYFITREARAMICWFLVLKLTMGALR